MSTDTIVEILLAAGLFVQTGLAIHYREQRDNLAAAWIHCHPEDFPSLEDDR